MTGVQRENGVGGSIQQGAQSGLVILIPCERVLEHHLVGVVSDHLGRLDLVWSLVLVFIREGAPFADAAFVCVEVLHTK